MRGVCYGMCPSPTIWGGGGGAAGGDADGSARLLWRYRARVRHKSLLVFRHWAYSIALSSPGTAPQSSSPTHTRDTTAGIAVRPVAFDPQAAINITNSVEEFGMYGSDGGRLWIRTGTESVHLWEWLRATDEAVPGGDMQFADFAEARNTASQACAASAAASLLPQVRASACGPS